MNNEFKSLQRENLLSQLKQLSIKLIEHGRTHLLQLCIIAGAIAAFLMPLYASDKFSLLQHTFIALSIVCFLFSILIGCMRLSFIILRDQRDIHTMKDAVEKNSKEESIKYLRDHYRTLKQLNAIDLYTLFVDILFSLGIIFLVIAIMTTEIRTFL